MGIAWASILCDGPSRVAGNENLSFMADDFLKIILFIYLVEDIVVDYDSLDHLVGGS